MLVWLLTATGWVCHFDLCTVNINCDLFIISIFRTNDDNLVIYFELGNSYNIF